MRRDNTLDSSVGRPAALTVQAFFQFTWLIRNPPFGFHRSGTLNRLNAKGGFR